MVCHHLTLQMLYHSIRSQYLLTSAKQGKIDSDMDVPETNLILLRVMIVVCLMIVMGGCAKELPY